LLELEYKYEFSYNYNKAIQTLGGGKRSYVYAINKEEAKEKIKERLVELDGTLSTYFF
jgi:predicted transcriptional regulator